MIRMFGFFAGCLLTPALTIAAPLPAEFAPIPQDAAMIVHVRTADLLQSEVVKPIRAKHEAMLLLADQLLQKTLKCRLANIESVTVFWPELVNPSDFEQHGYIITFREPYDKTKIADRPLNDHPGWHALIPGNTDWRFHFTTPKSITILSKLPTKDALKPTASDRPQLHSIEDIIAGKTTALVGFNFARFPAEIQSPPDEIRPIAPLFNATHLQLAAVVDKDIQVVSRANAKSKAAALDIQDAASALFALFDNGVREGKDELKEEDDRIYVDLLLALQTMYQAAKVERNENIITATMRFDGKFAFDKLVGTIIADASGQGGSPARMSQNNLKQIALAMHNFHDANEAFPPAAICDKKGKPLLSWRVMILPYIEQQALYEQFKLDEPWDSEHNKKLIAKMPKVYELPGHAKEGQHLTHYRLFVGGNAAFDYFKPISIANITDGLSNTLMVVEAEDGVIWTKPDELVYDPTKPLPKLSFRYNKRCNVAYMDGSVRPIRDTIDPKKLQLLIEPNDGQAISDDD